VRIAPRLLQVEDGAGGAHTDVTVSGPPMAMLRWVWNREASDEPTPLKIDGSPDAVTELKRCIATATQ
jgi:hypothetical protein